jgi:hypothetical protein
MDSTIGSSVCKGVSLRESNFQKVVLSLMGSNPVFAPHSCLINVQFSVVLRTVQRVTLKFLRALQQKVRTP